MVETSQCVARYVLCVSFSPRVVSTFSRVRRMIYRLTQLDGPCCMHSYSQLKSSMMHRRNKGIHQPSFATSPQVGQMLSTRLSVKVSVSPPEESVPAMLSSLTLGSDIRVTAMVSSKY
ncbi:hypothetical protein RRG08_019036 [Elysia crispata]|uniref:Uncharacterized protein n=1 Tax=Elysia crispata TaxID=231223 RepID=A0AAE1DT67_9GAST|nr:hypothetical protein RRG08_019036 [Elysia crispata]